MSKTIPDITYTLSPEEWGTYHAGEKVVLGGATFEVTEVLNPTLVRLSLKPTKWQRLKFWLKSKLKL